MSTKYILFNAIAGNGKCKSDAEALAARIDNSSLINMARINSYATFFEGLDPTDELIICGGDGTLNRFVNDTAGISVENPIYYYAVGSGNDFARDLGHASHDEPDFRIDSCLKSLPVVTVDGKQFSFINGIGYGIDGYCCEVGDKLRAENEKNHSDKPINYTAIAIKGLLFHYKPKNAVVTVDGVRREFKKVWLAPTMFGRYYGGGMMPTPAQDRNSEDKKVSLMVFHGSGKLKTLMIFPSIFTGEHVKHTKQISVFEGKEITVEYDRPAPLQIDGETILGVSRYSVSAEAKAEKKAAAAAK